MKKVVKVRPSRRMVKESHRKGILVEKSEVGRFLTRLASRLNTLPIEFKIIRYVEDRDPELADELYGVLKKAAMSGKLTRRSAGKWLLGQEFDPDVIRRLQRAVSDYLRDHPEDMEEFRAGMEKTGRMASDITDDEYDVEEIVNAILADEDDIDEEDDVEYDYDDDEVLYDDEDYVVDGEEDLFDFDEYDDRR